MSLSVVQKGLTEVLSLMNFRGKNELLVLHRKIKSLTTWQRTWKLISRDNIISLNSSGVRNPRTHAHKGSCLQEGVLSCVEKRFWRNVSRAIFSATVVQHYTEGSDVSNFVLEARALCFVIFVYLFCPCKLPTWFFFSLKPKSSTSIFFSKYNNVTGFSDSIESVIARWRPDAKLLSSVFWIKRHHHHLSFSLCIFKYIWCMPKKMCM